MKRSGVEIYSQWRFIACTGHTVYDLPVAARQEWIAQLVGSMREVRLHVPLQSLGSPPALADDRVMHQFWYASNASKFRALWRGEWRALGSFPSQSEADQALMTQLAFYSENDEQCRRLFRRSALGQRDKATADDRYVDLTLSCARGTHAPRLRAMAAIAAAMAPAIDAVMAQRKGYGK